MFVHKLQKYDRNAAVAVRDKLYFLVGEHALKQSKDFIDILEDGKFHYQVIPVRDTALIMSNRIESTLKSSIS